MLNQEIIKVNENQTTIIEMNDELKLYKAIDTFLNLKGKHVLEKFLESLKSKCTVTSYKTDLRDYFQIKDILKIPYSSIFSVTVLQAEEWVDELKKRKNKKGKKIEPSTMHRKVNALSSFYRWVMRYRDNNIQLIKYNPFEGLERLLPRVEQKQIVKLLTIDECKTLLNVFSINSTIGARNKLIISLALYNALRKSEIIKIKIKDIYTIGEDKYIKVYRKGNTEDYVKLEPDLVELIYHYLEITNRTFNDKESYLLLSEHRGYKSKGLSSNTPNRVFEKALKMANIDREFVFHDLRHESISLAIEEGATIVEARDHAGHKNVSTTSRYAHQLDKLKNTSSSRISGLFK